MTDEQPDGHDASGSRADLAVQRCLDSRSDPLADPEAVAALLAEPEALEAFARLHGRLAELRASSEPTMRARRSPWLLPLAALLVITGLATGIAFALSGPDSTPQAPAISGAARLLSVQVAEHSPAQVQTLSWSVHERHERSAPNHRVRVVITQTRSQKP